MSAAKKEGAKLSNAALGAFIGGVVGALAGKKEAVAGAIVGAIITMTGSPSNPRP